MADDMIAWLRRRADRSKSRLLDAVREADLTTPEGKLITRLEMDQVSDIQSQLKVIYLAEAGLRGRGDARFEEILKWLAYAQQTGPGYLETWAPEREDLVAMLEICRG